MVDTLPFGITASELTSARAVLQRYGARKIEDGEWTLQLTETSQLQIFEGSGLDSWWSVDIRSVGPRAAAFLFELACAGNFVIQPGDLVIATSEDVRLRLAESEPECLLVTSAEALLHLLSESFGEFQAYATRVLAPRP